MEVKHIYWIAGLLEGEGCFTFDTTPKIRLKMTDEDTIAKARTLMSSSSKIEILAPEHQGWKTSYRIAINGNLATQWMMTIYSLMSRRRKEEIRVVLHKWQNQIWTKGNSNRSSEKAVRLIAMSRKVSMKEAREIFHKIGVVN